MARVSGSVLGNLSGKLGNLSARTIEGKTIISARPSSFSVSQTPESISARSKFAVTGKFAKIIMDLPDLVSIWSKVKLSGMSVFNTLFKKNYPFSSADKPSADNIITPDGFNLPVQSTVLGADDLTVELDAFNTVSVFSADEVNLSINGLVVYHNPTDPEDDPYKIIKLSKAETGFDFTSVYTGIISLDVVQKAIAAKYQNSILYLAVATKSSAGKVVQYSATYTSQS
ncbi:MAG: hypothetical protein K9H48_17630 [Melioribacteraceae bacterium]|nr:hypothetical protein [Melioribacteraceae bacterium]MCF8395725.1 hypothetical protein [Melioribacteraceae bacterium]MCF8421203.1 hypothetical protein [Melioribacteraceae bacterium]